MHSVHLVHHVFALLHYSGGVCYFQYLSNICNHCLCLIVCGEYIVACYSFDSSYARSYRCFGNNLEQTCLCGIVKVSTAAEFRRNIACLYYSYNIAVLFTEQSHCALLACFLDRKFFGYYRNTCKNPVIYEHFNLFKLFGSYCTEVAEVETASVGIYKRACLMNVVAENLSERRL